MKIKKYIADDMQKAFIMIKEDLGKDAVILSSQKVRKKGIAGYFSRPVFEVIAAVDEEAGKKEFHEELSIKKLEYKINELQNMLKNNTKPEELAIQEHNLIKKIRNAGVSNDIIELIKNNIILDDSESSIYKVGDMFLNILKKPDLIKIENKPTSVLFVGPTGVGKTTTIAKLASNMVLKEKLKVALLTMDTYRIAAVEQIKKYGDILGIPTKVINNPLEITAALKEYKDFDLVLIDTAGRNHKNDYQLDEIKSLLKIYHISRVYLVLSLTTKDDDLKEIVDRYRFIENYSLLFTKQDETTNIGGIINVCYASGKSPSYVTNGQRVPDDITVFNPEQYVKELLRG